MPSKNTTIVAARIPDDTLKEINFRISRRGITLNKWLNWAIKNGLRKHRKNNEQI
ncbi:hypothetical protein LCGC14_0431420 [marine sediment metagenome]|uniref:Arc-like DNA binding domain-containing protein n=1 Tax=marine sediment metagenome TaxID=412755 RepID=A0A0F9T6B5_9ZZZZ